MQTLNLPWREKRDQAGKRWFRLAVHISWKWNGKMCGLLYLFLWFFFTYSCGSSLLILVVLLYLFLWVFFPYNFMVLLFLSFSFFYLFFCSSFRKSCGSTLLILVVLLYLFLLFFFTYSCGSSFLILLVLFYLFFCSFLLNLVILLKLTLVVLLDLFLSDAWGLIFWQPPTLFLAPVLFQQTRGHASQDRETEAENLTYLADFLLKGTWQRGGFSGVFADIGTA